MGGVISSIYRVILYMWRKPLYGDYHYSVVIRKPLYLTPRYIELEEGVFIFSHARIEGILKYNNHKFSPKIIFRKGSSVQQNLHLTCAKSIIIGQNTAIASNVTITDIHHPYTDIHIPIEKQDIEINPVEIGSDCKIYNNAVILPGSKIGKHVTVGANSVVSGIIPDYCVIVGAPAHIVRRYNFDTQRWERTNPDGSFIEK